MRQTELWEPRCDNGYPNVIHNPADPGGTYRARSHCRFVLPLIHFIPDFLTYSVPPFLKRQCDRSLGAYRLWYGCFTSGTEFDKGQGAARDTSDFHFRKTATEYDRKPGMKWLSFTAK
jgi:hypothetical protein